MSGMSCWDVCYIYSLWFNFEYVVYSRPILLPHVCAQFVFVTVKAVVQSSIMFHIKSLQLNDINGFKR